MESCQTSCWNTICDSCTGKRRWQGRTSRTLRFRKPWFPWRLQREDKLGLEKSSRRVRISTMILNYFRGDLRSPAMCIHVFTSSLACHNMRDLHQMWVNYFPSEIFMHLKCSSNVVKAFRANELELEKSSEWHGKTRFKHCCSVSYMKFSWESLLENVYFPITHKEEENEMKNGKSIWKKKSTAEERSHISLYRSGFPRAAEILIGT